MQGEPLFFIDFDDGKESFRPEDPVDMPWQRGARPAIAEGSQPDGAWLEEGNGIT